jgi:hypothetical protein
MHRHQLFTLEAAQSDSSLFDDDPTNKEAQKNYDAVRRVIGYEKVDSDQQKLFVKCKKKKGQDKNLRRRWGKIDNWDKAENKNTIEFKVEYLRVIFFPLKYLIDQLYVLTFKGFCGFEFLRPRGDEFELGRQLSRDWFGEWGCASVRYGARRDWSGVDRTSPLRRVFTAP